MSDRSRLRPNAARVVRCAIYTRKSTEEGLDQEFNSLDAQREAAEAYIRSQQHDGWTALPDPYDDGGFTGGNMERPALARLMKDIEAGRVNCVIVYKVDRLSRSLLDFARLMGLFDQHQVAFVSVTQQFNTATSMGRLVLNVLLSFAQFEREIISERTRDKIAATRRKGKWMGSHAPLGYTQELHPLRLVVDPVEAEQVRAIFQLYLELKSLRAVVEELERRGWTTKPWTTRRGVNKGGEPFTKNRLHFLLTCVVYNGQQSYKEERHKGEQEAIVTPEVWEAVQTLLQHNRNSTVERKRSAAMLRGLLRCQPCGKSMSPSFTSKAKGNTCYRYYTCCGAQQRGWATCPTKSIPAAEIERFVLERLELPLDWSSERQSKEVHRRVKRIEYHGGTGRLTVTLKEDAHES